MAENLPGTLCRRARGLVPPGFSMDVRLVEESRCLAVK
jgi:hypothetical protein